MDAHDEMVDRARVMAADARSILNADRGLVRDLTIHDDYPIHLVHPLAAATDELHCDAHAYQLDPSNTKHLSC
jgi:hypothetical protein